MGDVQLVPQSRPRAGEAVGVGGFQPPGRAATSMTPQVVNYDEGHEIRWRGRLLGTDLLFVGEHYFQIKPLPGDKALLLHGEDFRGCLVPLLGGLLKDTEKGFLNFNEGLKKAAESGK